MKGTVGPTGILFFPTRLLGGGGGKIGGIQE